VQEVLNQTIVRTERGLSIAGTRITIYQLMDYLKADQPTSLIKDLFRLSDEQMDGVLRYIAEHRNEVEAEYQEVLKTAEQNRAYWEERNRERLARIAAQPPKPGQEAIRDRAAHDGFDPRSERFGGVRRALGLDTAAGQAAPRIDSLRLYWHRGGSSPRSRKLATTARTATLRYPLRRGYETQLRVVCLRSWSRLVPTFRCIGKVAAYVVHLTLAPDSVAFVLDATGRPQQVYPPDPPARMGIPQ